MFLPGIDLSEKEQIIFHTSKTLEEKIERAIKLLKTHEDVALSMCNDGYYLCFSGGKDSIVIKRLAELAGVKYQSWYNNTTIDPPELVQFVKTFDAVRWNQPKKNLIMRMEDECQGPPTRIARWCCEIYKEQGGTGKTTIIGVRAAESPRRAKQWKETIANRNGALIVCPILYWTDADVWQFIKGQNLDYCSLYDEGFKRLGCVGCPMSGRNGRLRDFKRWPGFERLWKIGFQRYWNRWKGVPRKDGGHRWIEKFNSWEELWSWWMEDPENDEAEECQINLLNI